MVLLLAVGLVWLSRQAGSFLVKADPPQKSDAIVVLMGSTPDNVLHTVDLYKRGVAPKVIIGRTSMDHWKEVMERGVHPLVGADQFKEIAVGLGIPYEDILILPGSNNSTLDEAQLIREYIEINPEADTITVVCSKAHSRRAGMIFNKVFKSHGLDVHLVLSPSPYSDFEGKRWWSHRDNVEVVVNSWIKLIIFVTVEQWTL